MRESMKKLRIYSFTERGSSLNERLLCIFRKQEYLCEGYTVERFAAGHGLRELPKNWKETLGESWGEYVLLFIGAAGIAVRAAAPYVRDKFTDPPVIVLDERGQFVIPLLSGHVGGGVELAKMLEERIGAKAVITTATDVNEKFAVDVFAMKNHLVVTDREKAKCVSGAVLEGKTVGICSEFPLVGEAPDELVYCKTVEELKSKDMGIAICQRIPQKSEREENVLYLLPKNLYAGIGCRRGISSGLLMTELEKLLDLKGFVKEQICALGSINLKKEEAGLIELAEMLGVDFETFSADELKEMGEASSSSEFVAEITGVDNVCERAGRKLCPEGTLVQKKVCMEKSTAAIVSGHVEICFWS